VEKGQRVGRDHMPWNTPQWHRNVTRLPSETFAPCPVSLRHLLLTLPHRSNVLPEFSCEKKPWNFAPRPGIACKYCDARCFACKYPPSLSKKRQVLVALELQWDESFMLRQTEIILGRINVRVSIYHFRIILLSRKLTSRWLLTIF